MLFKMTLKKHFINPCPALVLGHKRDILTRDLTTSLWRRNLSVPSWSGPPQGPVKAPRTEAPCQQPFRSHLKGQSNDFCRDCFVCPPGKWLQQLREVCTYNPLHPPSHFHACLQSMHSSCTDTLLECSAAFVGLWKALSIPGDPGEGVWLQEAHPIACLPSREVLPGARPLP